MATDNDYSNERNRVGSGGSTGLIVAAAAVGVGALVLTRPKVWDWVTGLFGSGAQQNTETFGKLSGTTSASEKERLLLDATKVGDAKVRLAKGGIAKQYIIWPSSGSDVQDYCKLAKWTSYPVTINYETYKFPQAAGTWQRTMALCVAGLPFLIAQTPSKCTRVTIKIPDLGCKVLKFYMTGSTSAQNDVLSKFLDHVSSTGQIGLFMKGRIKDLKKKQPNNSELRRHFDCLRWLFGGYPWYWASNRDLEVLMDNGKFSDTSKAVMRRSGADTMLIIDDPHQFHSAMKNMADWWNQWCHNMALKTANHPNDERWTPCDAFPFRLQVAAGRLQLRVDSSYDHVLQKAKAKYSSVKGIDDFLLKESWPSSGQDIQDQLDRGAVSQSNGYRIIVPLNDLTKLEDSTEVLS